MNLTQFSAEDLQRITDIVRKKEEHLRAASALDLELAQIGTSGIPAENHRSRLTLQPMLRGSVQDIMLQALRNAGPAGKTTRELAQATNRKVPQTGTWLRTFLVKRPKDLMKQGDRWILQSESGISIPPSLSRLHRGTASEVILSALKRAGEAGLTIPAMEQQTSFDKSKINGTLYRAIKAGSPIRRMGGGLYVYIEPTTPQ